MLYIGIAANKPMFLLIVKIVFYIADVYNAFMFEKILNILSSPVFIYCLCVVFFILFLIQSFRLLKVRVNKKAIRSDAIKRSRAVINGQVVEQIAPYLPKFPCNPADAKFLGKPIDFIAFKGLTDKDTVDEILLIEVKTGKSELSKREKDVRKAVREGRVRYIEYRAFSSK